MIPGEPGAGFSAGAENFRVNRETARRAARYQVHHHHPTRDETMNDLSELRHIFPFLIPIVAIVMGVGIGMLAIWIDYRKKREIFELHHKERLLAIERGMEVPALPEALFDGGRRPAAVTGPGDYLRRGLLWLLVGMAITAALAMSESVSRAVWGLIPIAVGMAYLIFYATDVRMRRAGGEGLIARQPEK